MKHYLPKFLIFSLLLSFLVPLSVGAVAVVKIENPLGVNSFVELLIRIAEKVGELIAILGTIMIIISGILYLTSAGSPERINKAKTALIYAIAGIAIGIAAKAISTVILDVIGAK